MKRIFFLYIYLTVLALHAQDPQYSQYYAAPLLLNPAMTGATDCYRVGINARTQWNGLPKSFNTASFYIDLNHSDIRSGFGLMALRDQIGTPRLTSNEVSGFYSYLVPFSSQFNIRFGLQGTYVAKSIGYNKLIFGDQFAGSTLVNGQTEDGVTDFNKTQYLDVAGGILLFGEKKYWLGFATHHLNQPKQSFYLGESRLPRKYSVHGGYNFFIREGRRAKEEEGWRITPTFVYKWQTQFDQLDLGAYIIKYPMTVGVSYRGIYFKDDFKIKNNDALIFLLGFQVNSFSFGYSYDLTTSRLQLSNTYGSHEISMVYLFCLDWPSRRKPPRNVRRLPCPDFQRSIK